MKKKILSIVLIIIMLSGTMFVLTGCGANLKRADKKEGLSYINEKYSKDMYKAKNIEKAFYVSDRNIDYRIMFSDGKSILKINDEFYDDIQSEEIKSDFDKYFAEKILNTDYSRNEISVFTEYDTRVTDYDVYNSSLSIFRDRYDGNIEDYIKKHNLIIEGEVVVWCQKDEADQKYKEIEKRIKDLNGNYKYSIAFVDASLKPNYESRENIYKLKHDFTQDGVFYIMNINNGESVKYINIQNGFGITLCDNSNFELMYGDILLVSDIPTKEELMYISEYRYGITDSEGNYNGNLNSTYRIQFSDRVHQYLNDNQKDYLEVKYINNHYCDFSIYHIGDKKQYISSSLGKVHNGDLVYEEYSNYFCEQISINIDD